MTRLVVACALVCSAVLLAPAAVAGPPLRGTIARAYMAAKSTGKAQLTFGHATPHIYANFIWKRAPTPGQKLTITWNGPDGKPVARWTSKTLKSDTAGTRLYAWVTPAVYGKRHGRWHAVLAVGNVTRGTLGFAVS